MQEAIWDSERLKARACAPQASLAECYWGRGLQPKGWSPDAPTMQAHWSWNSEADIPEGSKLILASDASGGPQGSDPLLRRVGYGAALL